MDGLTPLTLNWTAPNGLTPMNGSTPNVTYLNDGGAAAGYDAYGPVGGGYLQGSPNYMQGSPAPDPYAQWGGKANHDSLVNQFNAQKAGVFSSANEAGDQFAGKYGRSILDFLDSARLGQGSIDSRANKNELAKQQGTSGVLGMVGRGIRSSGVQLANRNAGNSSAAGALANAYGQLGRGELSKVGNQYEQGNADIADLQNTFNVQQQSGIRNLQGGRDESVNAIVNSAGQSLADLDARIAGASLPDRIAIEQEKNRIKSETIAKLQAFDQQLTQGIQGIQPTSIDARRAKAAELARAGTDLGAGAFDFATETPTQFQGTGPFSSELPLFTAPRRRLA